MTKFHNFRRESFQFIFNVFLVAMWPYDDLYIAWLVILRHQHPYIIVVMVLVNLGCVVHGGGGSILGLLRVCFRFWAFFYYYFLPKLLISYAWYRIYFGYKHIFAPPWCLMVFFLWHGYSSCQYAESEAWSYFFSCVSHGQSRRKILKNRKGTP